MNLHSSEITVADSIKRRWYPYNKGGGYRKWYGFNEYLVDWYNDAAAIRAIKTAVIANYQYFMSLVLHGQLCQVTISVFGNSAVVIFLITAVAVFST